MFFWGLWPTFSACVLQSHRGAAGKKKAKGGLTEEQIEEICEAFNLFD